MRSLGLVTLVFAFALVGAAALADDTMSCPPAPAGVPAGVGAGPVQDLQNVYGPGFDQSFMKSMYQQHANVAALATIGIEQASDKNLRNLSGKIRYEQTKDNQKLAMNYKDLGFGAIPVDFSKAQVSVNSLAGFTPADFDVGYARTMIALLQQTVNASSLGSERLANPDLRNQSDIVSSAATNEIIALQRWLTIKAPGVDY